MTVNNWELVLIFWFSLELGLAASLNGRPRIGKYSFISQLFTFAILIWIMYNAGLFRGI